MEMNHKFTQKQQRFIDAYMGEAAGNATEACRLAGYEGNDNVLGVQGYDNLRNPKIAKEIERLVQESPLIASRTDRQRFWTEVMSSSECEMKDRLRASEILGKSQGDFIDRVEVKNYNYDLSNLTDEEIDQLEEAEDPESFLKTRNSNREGEKEA